MKKYRLKPDARKFFDKKYHENIYELKTWETEKIPLPVLDEVERVYIKLGHEKDNGTYKSSALSGWGDDKSHFHFTIHISDVEYMDHEKINVAEMMDSIQKVVNKFVEQ